MQTVNQVREWLDQVPPPWCPALEEFQSICTRVVKNCDDAPAACSKNPTKGSKNAFGNRRSSLRAALKYFGIARSKDSKEPALLDEVRTAIVKKGNAMHDAATNESPAAKPRPDHTITFEERDLQSPGDAEQLANSSHSNEDQPPRYATHRRKCRMYIKKSSLQKHGYTAGCAACNAHKEGKRVAGKEHTLQCRKRLEKTMAEDPDPHKRDLQSPADAEQLANSTPKKVRTQLTLATAFAMHTPCKTLIVKEYNGHHGENGESLVDETFETIDPAMHATIKN